MRELRVRFTRVFTPAQHNASCSSCHAKASVLTDNYKPGEGFFDYFDVVTLESPDYYPDGRDLYIDAYVLLASICESRGERSKAGDLYRRALSLDDLAPQTRETLTVKLAALAVDKRR